MLLLQMLYGECQLCQFYISLGMHWVHAMGTFDGWVHIDGVHGGGGVLGTSSVV